MNRYFLLLFIVSCLCCSDRVDATPADDVAQVQEAFDRIKLDESVDLSQIIPIDLTKFTNELRKAESHKLSVTIKLFQQLVEWGMKLRERSVEFSLQLKKIDESGEPISADFVETLNKGINEHLAFHHEILKVISAYVDVRGSAANKLNLSKADRVKAQMLTLSGALVLFDNFYVAVSKFYNKTDLRRMVNRGDSGLNVHADTLENVAQSYFSPSVRAQVREGLATFAADRKYINSIKGNDSEARYLDMIIRGSITAREIVKSDKFTDYKRFMALYLTAGRDLFKQVSTDSVNDLSQAFGNSIGMIQTRRGLLFNDKNAVAALKSQLKPLDILLDQTPFRLTAQFIPGYFGHVAIWTGTESELKKLGLWNHPVIKPHQKAISNGHYVIEALRGGVQINTLEHFMDVDDVAILRQSGLAENGTQNGLIRAFRQIGKEYDFNFDVETADKIVCSELAYVVFTDVKWPTEKMVGRSTISPDNVACMAIDGPFELVAFLQDGKILGDSKQSAYNKALQAKARLQK